MEEKKNTEKWRDPTDTIRNICCVCKKEMTKFKEGFARKFPLWWAELLVIGVLVLIFVFMFQLEKTHIASQTYEKNQTMLNGVYKSAAKWEGESVMTNHDLRMLMADVMEYHPGNQSDAGFYLGFFTQNGTPKFQSFDRNLMVLCQMHNTSMEDVYFSLDEVFLKEDVERYLDAAELYNVVDAVEGYVLSSGEFAPTKVVFKSYHEGVTEDFVLEVPAWERDYQLGDTRDGYQLVIYNQETTSASAGENVEVVNCYIDIYNTEEHQNDAAWELLGNTLNRKGDLTEYCYAKGGFSADGSFLSASECCVEFSGGGVYGILTMTFPLNQMALTSTALWSRMFCMIVVLQGGACVGFFLRRRMKKQKAHMDHMKNVFINAMAHEMKTPAAVIKNSTECILADIHPEKHRHYVEMIAKETEHMNDLLTKMLLYTRTVDSVYKLYKVPVDLYKMINDVTASYEEWCKNRSVNIVVHNLGMDEVFADVDLLKMAVDNFISNAVRYGKADSTITIGLCGRRFTIHNKCEPLTKEQTERIWEPLYVIDEARTATDSSAGMGLAICKNILELHDAHYGVENVEDGVRFYFELP